MTPTTRTTRLDWLGDEVTKVIPRLVRQPAYLVPAVLTLGLGIAATAIMWAFLHGILLRPLPYPEAGRLVFLASALPREDLSVGLARHQLAYFKENLRGITDMGLYLPTQATIEGDGGFPAERIRVAWVSASLFPVLGVGAHHGRLLQESDNLQVSSAVLVSHAYWMRRFGGDPGIIGRTLTIDDTAHEIVGILPPGATLPDGTADVWLPALINPTRTPQNQHTWSAVARLQPGVTTQDLEREIAPLVARMEEVFPSAYPNQWITDNGFRTTVTPLHAHVVGETVARALVILMVAAMLVLVVVLANVSNLVLVRTEGRRRELATRQALGAPRRNLVTLFLSEGLVVAILASAPATTTTLLVLGALPAVGSAVLPRLAEVRFGWPVGGVIAGVTAAAGFLLALFPLTVAISGGATTDGGSRAATASLGRLRVRNLLVVGQVALTLMLLVGAGLLVRSGMQLRAVDGGFTADGVTTLSLSLSPRAYQDFDRPAGLYQALTDRLTELPGVVAAGVSQALPLSGERGCSGIMTRTGTDDASRDVCVTLARTSPGYFSALEIGVRGDAPDWDDVVRRVGGVVVSQSLARRLWPDRDPIGQPIRCCGREEPWDRVVGVAGDVHLRSLAHPADEVAYFPLTPLDGGVVPPRPPRSVHLVVRAPTLDPVAVRSTVLELLRTLDPTVPVSEARAMTDVVADSTRQQSLVLLLLVAAAGMALLLSAIGLYAVVAYLVAQRRREIGIRIALGAPPRRITGLVLGHSLKLVAGGLAVGLVGAVLSTRVLRALLYDVRPLDAGVIALAVLIVCCVGVIAGWVPTARALRIAPAATLRED